MRRVSGGRAGAVDGIFETKKKDDYDFVDQVGRSIPLRGRPYMAIRLRRLDPPPAKPVTDTQPNDT